jgi:uncharacterized protein YukE
MGQAIVNPDDLRRFATQLRQFSNDLMGQMTVVHGQITGLGATWRDREYDKFAEEFETTMKAMKHFLDATNQFVPFLLRKAERVEEYLQQR